MRALVTGGAGFVGKQVVRKLMSDARVSHIVATSRKSGCRWDDRGLRLPHGRSYQEVWCELTDEAATGALLAAYRPEVIFHLAADPIIKMDEARQTRITQTNVAATHNLLAHCPDGCRFVLASSAAVYGDDGTPDRPATETQLPAPTSVYGATKVAAEALVAAHAALGRVSGLSLRLVANVGPGQTHGVLRDVMAKLRSGNPVLELLGDEPGSTKPYAHVSDTAGAFVGLGLNPAAKGAVNVAPDGLLSVARLAEVVMQEAGVAKPVRWLGEAANWRGDNRVVCVSAARARMLGWAPSVDSEGAVRKAVRNWGAA